MTGGPLSDPDREMNQLKVAFHRDIPYMSIHTKCEQGVHCTGPGCRVRTGKTRRSQAKWTADHGR